MYKTDFQNRTWIKIGEFWVWSAEHIREHRHSETPEYGFQDTHKVSIKVEIQPVMLTPKIKDWRVTVKVVSYVEDDHMGFSHGTWTLENDSLMLSVEPDFGFVFTRQITNTINNLLDRSLERYQDLRDVLDLQ